MASMRTQYNLSLYSKEFDTMKWAEFKALLIGLDSDTPLGRMIMIRLEDDPEVIKNFTPGQKKINSDWKRRRAKEVTQEEMNKILESFKNAFIQMAGSSV